MERFYEQVAVRSNTPAASPDIELAFVLSCSRYDYENCKSEDAEKMMSHIREVISSSPPGTKFGNFKLAMADDFEYTDPIDGSVAKKQGLRFVFEDGSRIIFRLSGTGASGATIRMYIEQYTDDKARLKEDAQVALKDIIKVRVVIAGADCIMIFYSNTF